MTIGHGMVALAVALAVWAYCWMVVRLNQRGER